MKLQTSNIFPGSRTKPQALSNIGSPDFCGLVIGWRIVLNGGLSFANISIGCANSNKL
jgi:hypothetical protein